MGFEKENKIGKFGKFFRKIIKRNFKALCDFIVITQIYEFEKTRKNLAGFSE